MGRYLKTALATVGLVLTAVAVKTCDSVAPDDLRWLVLLAGLGGLAFFLGLLFGACRRPDRPG